jgi:hypothetical protein
LNGSDRGSTHVSPQQMCSGLVSCASQPPAAVADPLSLDVVAELPDAELPDAELPDAEPVDAALVDPSPLADPDPLADDSSPPLRSEHAVTNPSTSTATLIRRS